MVTQKPNENGNSEAIISARPGFLYGGFLYGIWLMDK